MARKRHSGHSGEKQTDHGNTIRTLARKPFPQERAETRDCIAKTQLLRALNGDMAVTENTPSRAQNVGRRGNNGGEIRNNNNNNNNKISIAHIHYCSIITVGYQFQRVAVDILGPLPITEKWNKYMYHGRGRLLYTMGGGVSNP